MCYIPLCYIPLKALAAGGHFEYQHICTRAMVVPSAMPIYSCRQRLDGAAVLFAGDHADGEDGQRAMHISIHMPMRMPKYMSRHMPRHM